MTQVTSVRRVILIVRTTSAKVLGLERLLVGGRAAELLGEGTQTETAETAHPGRTP